MAFLKKGKTLCHLAALKPQCLQSKFLRLQKAKRKKTSSESRRACWLTAMGSSWKDWHDENDVESSVYDNEDDDLYLDKEKVFFKSCEGEDDADQEERCSWHEEDEVDDSVFENNEGVEEFEEERVSDAQVEKLSQKQDDTPQKELDCERQHKSEAFDEMSFADVVTFFDNFKKAQRRRGVTVRRLYDDEVQAVAENKDWLGQQTRRVYDWHNKQIDDDGKKLTAVERLDHREDSAPSDKPKLIKDHQHPTKDPESLAPNSNDCKHNTKIPLSDDADLKDFVNSTYPTINHSDTSEKFLTSGNDWPMLSCPSSYAYLMRIYALAVVPDQKHAIVGVNVTNSYHVDSALIHFIAALLNFSDRSKQRDLHSMNFDANHRLAKAATHQKINNLMIESQNADWKPPRWKTRLNELEQEKAVANNDVQLFEAEPVWKVDDDSIQPNDKHQSTVTVPIIINDDQEKVSTSKLLVNSVESLSTRRDRIVDKKVQISLPVVRSEKKECLDPKLDSSSSVDLKRDSSGEEPLSIDRESSEFKSSNNSRYQVAERCTKSSDADEGFAERQVVHENKDHFVDSVNVNSRTTPRDTPSTTLPKKKKHVTIIEEPTDVWEIPASSTTSHSNESLRVFCDSDRAKSCESESSKNSKTVTRAVLDSGNSQVAWSKVDNSSDALINKRSNVDLSKEECNNVKPRSSNILNQYPETVADCLETLPNKESSDEDLINITSKSQMNSFSDKVDYAILEFEKLLEESSNKDLSPSTKKPSSIKFIYDSSKIDLIRDPKQSRSKKDITVSPEESHIDIFNAPQSTNVNRDVLSDSEANDKVSPQTYTKLESRKDRFESSNNITVKKLKKPLSRRDPSKSFKENSSRNFKKSKTRKRFTDSSEKMCETTLQEAKPSNVFSDSSKKNLAETVDKPKSKKFMTKFAKENNTDINKKQKCDKDQPCYSNKDKREKSSCKKNLTASSNRTTCAEKLRKSKSRNVSNYSRKNDMVEQYEKSKSRKDLPVSSTENSMKFSKKSKSLSVTLDSSNKTCKASEVSQSNSLKKYSTKNLRESKSQTNFFKNPRENKIEAIENKKSEIVVPKSFKKSLATNSKNLNRQKDASESVKEMHASVIKRSKPHNNFSSSLKESCEDFAENSKYLKILPDCSKERHVENPKENESEKKLPDSIKQDFRESHKNLKTRKDFPESLHEKSSKNSPSKPLPETLRREITEFLRKTKDILPSDKKASRKTHSELRDKNIHSRKLTDKSVATWSRKPVENELLMTVNNDQNPSTSKQYAVMVGAPGANKITSLTTKGSKEFQRFQRMESLLRKMFSDVSSDNDESSTCVDAGFRCANESDKQRQSSRDTTLLDRKIDSEAALQADVISIAQTSAQNNLNKHENEQVRRLPIDDLPLSGGEGGECLMVSHYSEHDEVISSGDYRATVEGNDEALNLYRCCLVVSFIIVFLLLYLLWMAPPLLHKPIEL